MNGVHELRAPRHGRQRHPAAERLAADDEVGFDAEVLNSPYGSCPADAGLDLVVDVHDPVLVADLANAAEKLAWHGHEAALALHRLQHDAGDRFRVYLGLEEVLEPGEGDLGRDVAIGVGRRGAVDLGGERAEPFRVGHDLARHGHRHERAPVERSIEGDHSRATSGGASDLYSVLDRFCARVQEDALLRLAAAGRELGESAAHVDERFVGRDHEALVQVLIDLSVQGLDDRSRVVTEVLAADAADEVEVPHDRRRPTPLRRQRVRRRSAPSPALGPRSGRGPRGETLSSCLPESPSVLVLLERCSHQLTPAAGRVRSRVGADAACASVCFSARLCEPATWPR